MSRPASTVQQSARAVLLFGLVLGLVLAVSGGYVVIADRLTRLESAERKTQALTIGGQQLVWLELRNLQRALLGVAEDFDRARGTAGPLSPQSVNAWTDITRGVLKRQPELQDIVLADAHGQAIVPGRGEPSLTRWCHTCGEAGRLVLGPLQRSHGEWVVPVVVPLPPDETMLAWLRVAELQRLVSRLDTGENGRVRLLANDGTVLADSRSPAFIGRRVTDLPRPASGIVRVIPDRVDPLDGVTRITAVGRVAEYRLRISVGVSKSGVLAPWWRLVAAGIGLYLLYAVGLALLLRMLARIARSRQRLVRELRRTADDLQLAQRLGRTGTWTAERTGRIAWSAQVGELMGMPPERVEGTIQEYYQRIHPEDVAEVTERFSRAWSSGEPFAIDHRITGEDGRVHWVSIRGACVADADLRGEDLDDGESAATPEVTRCDVASCMSGTVVDITERMEGQERIADAERLFRQLFDQNPLPFWVFDVQTLRFLEVNQAALEQYGYSRAEFLAMTILDIRPPEERAAVIEDVSSDIPRRALSGTRIWRHQRKDGSLLEVRIYVADIDFRGRHARLVLAEDVTDRIAHQRELAWRASHDITTRLLNATALAEKLQTEFGSGCTVAYVQLRGLEMIEDSLGRKAGENTLRAVARRLQQLGDRYGAVGYIRTDEFALAVRDPGRWDEALRELQAQLALPVRDHDMLQRLEAWIGSAVFHGDGEPALQVIGNAGLAAHLARAERRPYVAFQPEMAQRASDRLRLAGRIHEAIERGEFQLHFQTIRCVADGRPAALEALIRWPQKQGGFIPPGEFIGICEDSGLIVPLGRWVMREAARTQRQLGDAGFPDLPIAVNVSLVQFLHGDLAADVDQVVAEFGLRRGTLHLELTESVLMTQPEQALSVLQRLQQLGVCVSLDDFGTGFSSLSYLRHLPLDSLKIDRSFVNDVDRDERNASICLALLALGRNLGLTVIAEGVENEAQLGWLREHGCDQAQGYALDRPAPLSDVLARLGAAPENVLR